MLSFIWKCWTGLYGFNDVGDGCNGDDDNNDDDDDVDIDAWLNNHHYK